MHCLENMLLMTSVAVEKDEIAKAELVRILESLAGYSHCYMPESGKEEAGIMAMNQEWHERFGHLMYGEMTEGEDDGIRPANPSEYGQSYVIGGQRPPKRT